MSATLLVYGNVRDAKQLVKVELLSHLTMYNKVDRGRDDTY